MIDFKEIPKAHDLNGSQDTFELFARDLISAMGMKIIKEPNRGCDGGQGIDIIAEEERIGVVGKTTKRWAISCKHKAHSGNSVTTSDEPDIKGRVESSRCDGFLGFYSTIISSGLSSTLNGFSDKIDIYVMSPNIIESLLTSSEAFENVFRRYLPHSYQTWKSSINTLNISIEAENMPSFSVILPVDIKTSNADRFYDGYAPLLSDLSADYDIQRDIYIKDNGIYNKLNFALAKSENIVNVFLINGVGGTGKTTLLKRIAYDMSKTDNNVFWLKTDWRYDQISVQSQIKHILSSVIGPVIFFIDDFSDVSTNNGIEIQSLLDINAPSKLIYVIADTPDRWNSVKYKFSGLVDKQNYFQFNLHQLSNVECERLIDKLYFLEETNLLTIKHRLVDRRERSEFYLNETKRHFVVIMYQLRYGAKFENIITNEYYRLVSEGAKKGYELVSLASAIGFKLPESILIECCYTEKYAGVKDFYNFLLPVLDFDKMGFSTRHPLIARVISRHVFTSPSLICTGLIRIIDAVTPGDYDDKSFACQLIQLQNFHKKIVRLLKKETALVRSFLEALNIMATKLGDNEILTSVLICSAMSERLIGDNGRALNYLFSALEKNPDHYFALRQIAWIYHDLGDWGNAALWAIKSATSNMDNAEQQFTTARILSLNTVSNFRLAKSYFERALAIDSSNRDLLKRYDEYQDAEKILQYFGSYEHEDMIPDTVLGALRPGLSFFKIYYGKTSKKTKAKLVGVLSKMEDEFSGTVEDLEDIVDGIYLNDNKLLYAKYLCNIGRLLYLDWYHNRRFVDVDDLENIFKESIRINKSDPYCHCWLGTYYKEIAKDYSKAEIEYLKATSIASKSKYENEVNHPLFENNLGLLFMDRVRFFHGDSSLLNRARQLFIAAEEKNKLHGLDFHWASRNLEVCDELLGTTTNSQPTASDGQESSAGKVDT